MKPNKHASAEALLGAEEGPAPAFGISKLGIVSRDYRRTYPNGYRDFSYALPEILTCLDRQSCDAVLFSSYSLIPRDSFTPVAGSRLQHIKALLYEEFADGEKRQAIRYVINYKTAEGRREYILHRVFGSLTDESESDIRRFVEEEMPKRLFGNCCVLLCGETNGVKYSPKDKRVHDIFHLRAAIPKEVKIILNPVHDHMTRFEMNLKRKFLSRNDRWVVSVWNKGKENKDGKVRDGKAAAWIVFHDGKQLYVQSIPNEFGVEMGLLEIRSADMKNKLA